MIIIASIIGLAIGGALVTVCSNILGPIVHDAYSELKDNFMGIFGK